MSPRTLVDDLFDLYLARKHRKVFILLFVSLLVIGFWLGIPVVEAGLLGRHAYIWELLPFASGFNPLLGLGLWVGFVAGDFSTKEIGPATGNLGKEYWFILYAAMLAYTLIPSIAGRIISFSGYSSQINERSSDSFSIRKVFMNLFATSFLAFVLIQGINIGNNVIFPSIIESIWKGTYIGLGNDPSCIGTTNMLLHSWSSIYSLIGGTLTGNLIRFGTLQAFTEKQRTLQNNIYDSDSSTRTQD